jgi:hypothetical protein
MPAANDECEGRNAIPAREQRSDRSRNGRDAEDNTHQGQGPACAAEVITDQAEVCHDQEDRK